MVTGRRWYRSLRGRLRERERGKKCEEAEDLEVHRRSAGDVERGNPGRRSVDLYSVSPIAEVSESTAAVGYRGLREITWRQSRMCVQPHTRTVLFRDTTHNRDYDSATGVALTLRIKFAR